MKNCIIVDIDGTVADASHRLHHIHNEEKKDWNAFFEACVHDSPIHDIIDLVRISSLKVAEVIYVSGRSDQVRLETRAWMYRHNLPYGRLFMRKAGDRRPDFKVKEEILDDELQLTPEQVWFVLDDRNQVVDMWRRRGFRVLQVADGAF